MLPVKPLLLWIPALYLLYALSCSPQQQQPPPGIPTLRMKVSVVPTLWLQEQEPAGGSPRGSSPTRRMASGDLNGMNGFSHGRSPLSPVKEGVADHKSE